MKTFKLTMIISMALLSSLLVLLPLISACTPSTPATTGKTLKVGIVTPTTGRAAEKGAPMGHANLYAIEYINAELGGAGGYKIDP